MNSKQTMKFPLETPGQKNEGKSAPGRAHLGIFFFFLLNPKYTGKNKPTRLHQLYTGCQRQAGTPRLRAGLAVSWAHT